MGQTYPLPITADMVTRAYVPVTTWYGGAVGNPQTTGTATSSTDFTPKTPAAKATALGQTFATVITRSQGWNAPGEPYGPVPAAPVVTSLSPSTGAAATLPLTVTITGTGFSPFSVVKTGGSATADVSGTYVNATTMRVAIYKATPGTVSVAVEDHGVLSNTDKVFTVT